MCLKAQKVGPVPEETAALVRSLLPPDHRLVLFGDGWADWLRDEDFAQCYPPLGQPALSPALLAQVTLLQYLENLSDRQAAAMVVTRLDWKYALHLPLDYPGFDASVLCEFRDRLEAHQGARALFERELEKLRELGLLRTRSRQRTDSLAVLGAVRELTRLELLEETLRLALTALEQQDLAWLRSQAPPEWAELYGAWGQEERLVRETGEKGRAEARRRLETAARNGQELLEALRERPALQALPEVQTLGRVWEQQVEAETGELRPRPTGAEVVCHPADPEVRRGVHGGQAWEGYRVHLTETVEEDHPRIVTDLRVVAATTPDCQVVPELLATLEGRDLLPSELLMDRGYVSGANLAAGEALGVEVLGPVQADRSVQGRAGEGLSLEHFEIDWEGQRAVCPQGVVSRRWRQGQDERGPKIEVSFPAAVCQECPLYERCVHSQKARPQGRHLHLREHHRLVRARREAQKTREFWERYAARAGIEATLHESIRDHGLREARYLGPARVELQGFLTVLALNLKRCFAWQQGRKVRRARRPGLRGLAQAA